MFEHIRIARIPAFLLALLACVPLTVAAAESDEKPNIVLVLMDNFSYGEIGECDCARGPVANFRPLP